MVKALNKLSDVFNKLIISISCIFLVISIVACFVQVFTRYMLSNSATWTEETARLAYVWMNLMACSAAVKFGNHAAVTAITDKLKGRAVTIQAIMVNMVILIIGIIMIVEGINLILIGGSVKTTVLRIPMWAVYVAIPFGGVGNSIQAINNIVTLLVKEGTKAKESDT